MSSESLVVKVCVAGPTGSGKTYLTKLLAQSAGTEGYRPTVAVRIQEVERIIAGERIVVQLWDCSGDNRYSAGWPALAREMHGLILTYNPEGPNQEMELEGYARALGADRLQDSQILLLAIKTSPGMPRSSDYGMQGQLRRYAHEVVALPTSDTRDVSTGLLYKLLDRVLDGIVRRRREEEEKAYF